MENLDGALGFRATLDIDDFTVSTQAMERRIKDFSASATDAANETEDAFRIMAQKAGEYITYYLVGQGMTSLLNSIIQTRGQFQQLEIAFETMLGSSSKANTLMQQMIDTAAKTPFDLMGVAEGAKQLMAYGVSADKVNDTLVRLGNVASGLSIPLNDIVYLYGTTMVQGRLYAQDVRQFTGRGIPLVKELAEKYHKSTDEINAMVSAGKIGFKDVEEVLNKMTDAGGQFYNLMEKQSASLTGQIANLEDAWDTALNSIGQANQDTFSTAISAATWFVENMDGVLRVLKSIAIAYGTVNAAIIANTLATKGLTGVAIIDNTVRAAKIALLKAEDAISGKTRTQTQAMTQSELAYARAIEASMTQEERDAFVKQMRIAAIASLLTAQQQEYLSNIGLTISSEGYESAAVGVMSAEQRLSLSKLDLTNKSAAYRAAIVQNTKAELDNINAKVAQLETEKRVAIEQVEAQKLKLLSVRENINAMTMEMSVAGANCDVTRAATIQKKIEAAQDQAAIIQKELLVLESNRLAKSKALETAQTRQSALASSVDTAQKAAQTASTNILSVATGKLNVALKALWTTIKANPFGMILSVVGMVWSALAMFGNKTKEVDSATEEFNKTTKEAQNSLNTYFMVLQSTDKETKTHKDALEKINAVCQEYNKTLLDENATIDIQKLKYQELTKAIQESTAAKVVKAAAEKAQTALEADQEKHETQFENRLNDLQYNTGRTRDVKAYGETYTLEITAAAENAQNLSDDLRKLLREMIRESAAELSTLTGNDFDVKFNQRLTNITNGIVKAGNLTKEEIPAMQGLIEWSINQEIKAFKKKEATVENARKQMQDYYDGANDKPDTTAVDYATMSFSELDTAIKTATDKLDTYKELTKEQIAGMKAAGEQMLSTFTDSNVALLARPIVDAAKLAEKGWKDAGDGIQTVFAQTMKTTNKKGEDVEFLISPILPDGTVLSKDELTTYVDEKLKGADNLLKADDKKLLINVGADPDKSVATLLQKLQDIYYLCDKDASVKIDTKKLQEMTSTLGELLRLATTVEKKTADLNSEKGMADRIKQLKEERQNATTDTDRAKLTKEIDALEKRYEKIADGGKKYKEKTKKEAEERKRNNEALRKAQQKADYALEEARIEAMEEGFEKRKATLELQHRKTLEAIEDERKQLIEARKKAKKGGLTQDEEKSFTERKKLANSDYEKASNKLFEGELDYKKKQYTLYWRWVENLGKDVADKQFASLLKSGGSYKAYIEKQIADLKQKQANGVDLTEGEKNFLINLNVQYDELTGAKSALDQFRDSVSKSISQSATLAEKLEAIAKAKKELQDGKSGIVGEDDRATAMVGLTEQETEIQQEIEQRVINDFRSFEQQRLDIQQDYALLRQKAQAMGDEKRLELINKGEQEALSALDSNFLQQSDSWKRLFSDMDTLSVAQIEQCITDIEAALNAGTLKLSPVDYKAVIDSLNKAKERINEINPFKGLDKYFNDYIAAKKKLAKAQADLAAGKGSQKDVDAAQREVKSAANGLTKSINSVTDVATSCGSSLQNMFDALGMDGAAEGLGDAIALMGELGNAAQGVGQIMSGDIVGGVTSLLSTAANIVGIFAKIHDRKYEKKSKELQKQIDALDASFNRLERAYNNTYWVFNDEQKAAYERNISLIEKQIATLEKQAIQAKKTWNFAQYAKCLAELSKLKKELSTAKENGDINTIYEAQKKNLKEQQQLLQEQIKAEKSKKKTDSDKIKQYNDQIEAINQQLEDMERARMEMLAGTDIQSAIDTFADALVDAYCQGEDAAEALADTTKSVLKKAVVDALKRQFLAKAIDDAIKYLADHMADGVLTDTEKAEFENRVNKAGDTFNKALEAVGDWIKDAEAIEDPLSGAVKSMSEETAGVIAGRLNAFIINQGQQTDVLRQQLLMQSDIARNTKTTADILNTISATLRRIETKDNSLLSQGIQ